MEKRAEPSKEEDMNIELSAMKTPRRAIQSKPRTVVQLISHHQHQQGEATETPRKRIIRTYIPEKTEGATEVSKHKAEYDHLEGDFEIKAITYYKNFHTRGIREAIEIRKNNPSLNSDNGRYFLPKIYDLVLSRDRNPSHDNGTI